MELGRSQVFGQLTVYLTDSVNLSLCRDKIKRFGLWCHKVKVEMKSAKRIKVQDRSCNYLIINPRPPLRVWTFSTSPPLALSETLQSSPTEFHFETHRNYNQNQRLALSISHSLHFHRWENGNSERRLFRNHRCYCGARKRWRRTPKSNSIKQTLPRRDSF